MLGYVSLAPASIGRDGQKRDCQHCLGILETTNHVCTAWIPLFEDAYQVSAYGMIVSTRANRTHKVEEAGNKTVDQRTHAETSRSMTIGDDELMEYQVRVV